MKNIDQLLVKTQVKYDPSQNSTGRVELLTPNEAVTLAGGDKEYKPIYDERDTDEHFRFGASSVFNFFDNLF
uniref:Uncharacterized protein n=1 Tax=Roseihalotalea indica TaxID=2867963 RepID=A0AA49JIA3_9BACT|nr:hypothetical protein K4G66_16680 [Tunicatimonas sp. TK19036]